MKHEEKIRHERREVPIKKRGSEENRIKETTHYLSMNQQWILDNYEHADRLALSIIAISNRIKFVLEGRSEDTIIGKCPSLDDEGNTCGATLKINAAELEKTLEVKCRACGTVWASQNWRLLGKVLQNDKIVK